MDKIGNISQIIAIIRNQTRTGVSETTNKKPTATEIQPPAPPKKISKNELKKNLRQKLRAASKNPDFASKSKDIFLESVMLWEFGDQLVNDPLFDEIKSKVRQTIESNTEASEKLSKLINQLSAG